MYFRKSVIVAVSLFAVGVIADEHHTITLSNNCGYGTPTLVSGSTILSTGEPYTAKGEIGFQAFLQIDDECGTDGDGCIFVGGTLSNTLSHAAIFLFPNAKFTVPTGYNFVGGGACDGTGQDCTEPGCPVAVNNPTFPGGGIPIHFAGVNCSTPNVDFNIKFCE